MAKATRYEDLEIWQLGMSIAESVYRLTDVFPEKERFGLTSQMRRAAVSISANIAEGWGRNSQANLINFVRIARGSGSELKSLVELSRRLGLLTPEEIDDLARDLDVFGKLSFAFIAGMEKRCIREDRALYDAQDH